MTLKDRILCGAILIASTAFGQVQNTNVQKKTDGSNSITGPLNFPSGLTLSAQPGAIVDFTGATLRGFGSGSSGVNQILAGTNVTISPLNGQGTVTVNATGGGSGGVAQLFAGSNVALSPTNGLGNVTISFTGAGASYTFISPLVNSGGNVTINQSTSTVDGFLSHTDWVTFNGKISPSSTAVLTNKTYDTSGTGNIFKIGGQQVSSIGPSMNITGGALNAGAPPGYIGQTYGNTLANNGNPALSGTVLTPNTLGLIPQSRNRDFSPVSALVIFDQAVATDLATSTMFYTGSPWAVPTVTNGAWVNGPSTQSVLNSAISDLYLTIPSMFLVHQLASWTTPNTSDVIKTGMSSGTNELSVQYFPNTNSLEFVEYVSGTPTTLGTATVTLSPGDSIGYCLSGQCSSMWAKLSGKWACFGVYNTSATFDFGLVSYVTSNHWAPYWQAIMGSGATYTWGDVKWSLAGPTGCQNMAPVRTIYGAPFTKEGNFFMYGTCGQVSGSGIPQETLKNTVWSVNPSTGETTEVAQIWFQRTVSSNLRTLSDFAGCIEWDPDNQYFVVLSNTWGTWGGTYTTTDTVNLQYGTYSDNILSGLHVLGSQANLPVATISGFTTYDGNLIKIGSTYCLTYVKPVFAGGGGSWSSTPIHIAVGSSLTSLTDTYSDLTRSSEGPQPVLIGGTAYVVAPSLGSGWYVWDMTMTYQNNINPAGYPSGGGQLPHCCVFPFFTGSTTRLIFSTFDFDQIASTGGGSVSHGSFISWISNSEIGSEYK